MAAELNRGSFEPGYVIAQPHKDQPPHQRIRNTIALYGLSGRKFAHRVGIHQAHLSRFFKGYRVRPETLAKIEKALAELCAERGP